MTEIEASLRKRYLFKLMTNVIGLGIGLGTQSIVPRSLGPVSYGNFSFLTNFFWQVIGFLNLNSSTAFYTILSQRQTDRGLVAFYVYLTLVIGLLMSVGIMVCYCAGVDQLVWPEQSWLFVIMAAIWAMLQLYSGTLVQISDAYGLTTKSEIVNILQRGVGLLVVACLFWGNWLNLFNYFVFQFGMFLGIIVLLCLLIKKYKSPFLEQWRLGKEQIKSYGKEFATFCMPLIIFSFFAIFEQMLDRWCLQKISGSAEQGFYNMAYQTGTICFLFVSAMIPLIMREYAVSFAKRDMDKIRQLFSKYSKMLFVVAAFFGCFLAAEAKSVMLIFGGRAYTGAVIPIMIMCFYPIHQTYGQMNAAFFLPRPERKLTAISVLV